MGDAAIEVWRLVKSYGEKRALDEASFTVPEGSVFGFLGPNGAGKTTTLRILTGLAAPTSGEARVFGRDVETATNEVRASIGFLPDVPGFYDWMTAEEFLRFAGQLFGLEKRSLDERVRVLLDLAGLTGVEARIGGYSRGMKQRLGIAQALVNAPRLLMLDEPTSALDPIGRKEVLDMVASLRGRTTVFFSTHILSDVERVCDTVAVLDHGRVVVQSATEDLKARGAGAKRIEIEVDERAAELAEALASAAWAVSVEREGQTLDLSVTDMLEAQRELPRMIADKGIALKRLTGGEATLEDVFVDLVGGQR